MADLGRIISYSSFEVVLGVPVDGANAKIGRLVSKLPVIDININSITLEEIVSDIFTNGNGEIKK